MKRLIVTDSVHGGRTEVTANKTFEADTGRWLAEVDAAEIRRACFELCDGVRDCCDNLHVEADQDDDGKEYRMMASI